jgi:DNA repair exonuclease SbcCD ATPase subunit
MDLTFKKLRFRNLMSFGNMLTEIDLDQSGTALIVGENLDQGGSSGAGKTTILNAFRLALFNDIPDVKMDALINDKNEKKNVLMEVELEFTKGNDEYMIRRFRGAQTGAKLVHNGIDITPASIVAVDAMVVEIIGFSHDLFKMVGLFNGNDELFLNMKAGPSRELMEELFHITLLSKKAVVLKKQISDTNKGIDMQTLLNDQVKLQNEKHRKHVNETQDRADAWGRNRINELEALNQKLKMLECKIPLIDAEVDAELENELTDLLMRLQSKLDQYEANLEKIKDVDFEAEKGLLDQQDALNTTIKERRREVDQIELQLDRELKESKKIEDQLVHLIDSKCPFCLQAFESQDKIEELQEQFSTLSNSTNVLKRKVAQVVMNLNEALNELKSVKAQVKYPNLNELISIKNDLDKQKAKLDQEQAVAEEKVAQQANLASERKLQRRALLDEQISNANSNHSKLLLQNNPLQDSVDALLLEGEQKVDVDAVEQLREFLENQKMLLKLLTDNKSFIRKGLIGQTLPFLNKRIGFYTEKLNLPHLVMFQPDLTCEITRHGLPRGHGNLSNGEKKKLNLALCMSFRDVLTYLHARVNVLFTDEVDGGSISGPDIDSLIGLLKHKAWEDKISIFIISHATGFENRCDRTFVVRKEKEFSTLITQPD